MMTAIKDVLNARLTALGRNEIRVGIGIAHGTLLAIRVGIRGTNDLVWAGNPVNLASKLADMEGDSGIRIEEVAHNRIKKNTNCVPEGTYTTKVLGKEVRYFKYEDCGYFEDLRRAGLR